jgi:hypothetical protein
MHRLATLPLALLTAACWTPGPGQLDPTRYPWNQPHRLARAAAAPEYCVVSLESGSTAGIDTGGSGVMHMGCQVQPNRRPPSAN